MISKTKAQAVAIVSPLVLVTVASVTFWAVGGLADPEKVPDLALGAIGACLGLLIDLIMKIELRARRSDGISALLAELDALPDEAVGAAQRRLYKYAQAFHAAETVDASFIKALDARLLDQDRFLDAMAEGRLTVEIDDPTLLIDAMRTSSREDVYAVTCGEQSMLWWWSEAGREYWRDNMSAIRDRGVQVQRIFVERSLTSAATKQRWVDLVREQVDGGVQVSYLRDDPEQDVDTSDMTLFGTRRLHSSARSGRTASYLLSVADPDIAEARQRFDALRGLATAISKDGGRLAELEKEVQLASALPDTVQDTTEQHLIEPEFLHKVFIKGMPPAFVKAVPKDGNPYHVLESDALTRIESSSRHKDLDAVTENELTRDYDSGDERTLAQGFDRQVELAESRPGGRLRRILTCKTRIRYKDETYIVGWYVPVMPEQPLKGPDVILREDGGQIVFSLAQRDSRTDGARVFVGEALQQRS